MKSKVLICAFLIAVSAPALACGPTAPKPASTVAAEAKADVQRVQLLLGDHAKLVAARIQSPGFVRGAALEQALTTEAREKAVALLAESSSLLSHGGTREAALASHKAKQALVAVGVHEFAVTLGCGGPRASVSG